LRVAICHLTDFALVEESPAIYLPVIVK